ncbi:MAG: hypothetical protein H0U76_23055, partial [Ktedonobacteraceae bacterium]|nr:hypothetical protein [Ktedonobacteraceae bacterium]
GTNERFESIEAFWRALQAQPTQDIVPVPVVQSPITPMSVIQSPVTPVYMRNTTPVTPSPESETTEKHLRPAKRRRLFVPILAFIALLALLIGLLAGNNLLSVGAFFHAPGAVMQPTAKPVTTTAPMATAQPTSVPTLQPTTPPAPMQPITAPAPQATTPAVPAPQPVPVGYPQLFNYYGGTISDRYTTPATGAAITLSALQQNGSAINGRFAVGSGLLAGSTFSGSVTRDRKIEFIVPGYAGLADLLFDGQIQSDGSLSGTYCSMNANRQCDKSMGGWGDWNAVPPGHPSSFVPDGIAFKETRFS